jgi:tRNA(Ile)-lysidine synthase
VSDLTGQIEHSIRTRGLLKHGQAILLAVSGGSDSMVLLHVLHDLSQQHSWHLTVAHLNHRLRGRSSEADERLVVRTARRLGLPCVVGHVDVKKFARAHKLSIEMAARELRHGFLARTATRLKIPAIALAHHADDQVELFLLRLLRGSGGEGLAGMRWRSPSPANPKLTLVRPMLSQSKAALLAHAAQHKIPFCEDVSNARLNILRNRIRHELLPLLRRKYQPAVDKTILRSMDIVGNEADFVDAAATEWTNSRHRAAFVRLPLAVQRRCIQLQLLRQKIAMDYDLVERLRMEPERPIEFAPRRTVSRDSVGQLHLRELKSSRSDSHEIKVQLNGTTGSVVFNRMKFQWRIVARKFSGKLRPLPGREYFDADKVGATILLRHWRPGDRFQPIGMFSAVKLQDLFTNQKIPKDRRHRLVLAVTGGGEVFWVERLRISDRFKLSGETIRRLHWRWKRL